MMQIGKTNLCDEAELIDYNVMTLLSPMSATPYCNFTNQFNEEKTKVHGVGWVKQ